jgi:hypothetical protein
MAESFWCSRACTSATATSKSGFLGQEDKRLMGLVQAGLAIAEVEAAASRDLIGHGEECRLAITLKEIL